MCNTQSSHSVVTVTSMHNRPTGRFCTPNVKNPKGYGPTLAERSETKSGNFPKVHPNFKRGLEPNETFGAVQAGQLLRVAMCFGIAGCTVNFCCFCLFFIYVVIFEIIELFGNNFVYSNVLTRSKHQAISAKSSSSPSVIEKEYFVSRKQRVEGRGRRRKAKFRQHSLPSPLSLSCSSPPPSPPVFYSLSIFLVKQFFCCLIDYLPISPTPHCLEKQAMLKTERHFSLPRSPLLQLCGSTATGIPPKSL